MRQAVIGVLMASSLLVLKIEQLKKVPAQLDQASILCTQLAGEASYYYFLTPWFFSLWIEPTLQTQSKWGLWRCGSAEGLDAGRHCLKKWGFRRCEDICWIKTNQDPSRKASTVRQDANAVLQHTKAIPSSFAFIKCIIKGGCHSFESNKFVVNVMSSSCNSIVR